MIPKRILSEPAAKTLLAPEARAASDIAVDDLIKSLRETLLIFWLLSFSSIIFYIIQ
jgi:hypothetical protein